MKRGNIRKFGRTTDKRKAFVRSLATALILNRRITTTKTRAKALRSYVEKLITSAKKQTVTARRNLSKEIGTDAVKTIVDQIAPQFISRNGGYTRIVPLARRRSDGSEMSIIEFVS